MNKEKKAHGGNTTRMSVCSQTQHSLHKSWTQTHTKTATIATMQKLYGSYKSMHVSLGYAKQNKQCNFASYLSVQSCTT